MATDISNGKGGGVSVTETPQQLLLTPASGDGRHKTANFCKVWNTGTSTVYVVFNADATDQGGGAPFYVEADAIQIPSGEAYPHLSFGIPIRSLVVACATGETSTVKYGAS